MGAAADILALAELCRRSERRATALWICDCARRVLRERFEPSFPDDRARMALELMREFLRPAVPRFSSDSELLRVALVRAEDAYREHGESLSGMASEVAVLALRHALDPRETPADEVAATCLQRMMPADGRDPTRLLQWEERWQARRLLWRLRMMPTGGEIFVRLDQAEFAGVTPRPGTSAGRRFAELRERVFADEDARLDLILEFPEALFHAELGA